MCTCWHLLIGAFTRSGGSLTIAVRASSNDYTAANPITLTCEVTSGAVGDVTYQWSSTCFGDCFVDGQTTATVSTSALRSADSGTHSCTITDSVGNSQVASIDITVIGGLMST